MNLELPWRLPRSLPRLRGYGLLAAVALAVGSVGDTATALPRHTSAASIAGWSDVHEAGFRRGGRWREAGTDDFARHKLASDYRSQLGAGGKRDRQNDRRPRKRDTAHDGGNDKPEKTSKPGRSRNDHASEHKPGHRHERDHKKHLRFACVGGRVRDGACMCRGGARAQRIGAMLRFVCAPLLAGHSPSALPLAAAAAGATAAAAAPPPERSGPSRPLREPESQPDEVLFWLDGSLPEATETRIAGRLGLRIVGRSQSRLLGRRFVHARIVNGTPVSDVIARLRGEREITGPQPNYVYRQQEEPGATNKPLLQYALDRIDWPDARRTASGRGTVVAIIDTGLDRAHPGLAGADIREFDTGEKGAADDRSHGTALAGIIVGRSTTQGIAPDARVLSVRAFASTSTGVVGSTASILKAFDTAVAKGARVVNLSFAGPRDPSLEKAVEAAAARDIILVAAAGNFGHGAPPVYPAAYPQVIAVTATDAGDQLYEAANTGAYVAIAAPGVDVIVPVPGNSYDLKSGTSYAAAHVSGIVALMLERNPRLPVDVVRRRLADAAFDLGVPGPDEEFGAGRVNAALSLSATETSSR